MRELSIFQGSARVLIEQMIAFELLASKRKMENFLLPGLLLASKAGTALKWEVEAGSPRTLSQGVHNRPDDDGELPPTTGCDHF